MAKKKKASKKAAKKMTAKSKKTTVKKAKKVVAKAMAKPTGPVPPKKPVLVTPRNSDSKQYTQSEFFDCVQGYCGFTTRRDAKTFYGQFTQMVQQALKNGYKLALPGLGKLQVRKSKARIGINPATREQIKIPAKKRVRFTPNKALKESVL